MAVLDGSEIVYVARVAVRRLMSVALGVGARLPAFAASMGRVLLADKSDSELAAWLRENTFRPITAHTDLQGPGPARRKSCRVRRQGYAFVSQELELGLCSIAVPVRSAMGRGRVRSQRQHALQRRRESGGAEKNVARFASRASGD